MNETASRRAPAEHITLEPIESDSLPANGAMKMHPIRTATIMKAARLEYVKFLFLKRTKSSMGYFILLLQGDLLKQGKN